MRAGIAILILLAVLSLAHARSRGVMPLPLLEAQAPGPARTATAGALDPQLSAVQRYGTVIERRLIGAGGLTAWTVEKNGRRVVLYTTGDGQAIIAGVVWDARSGQNLSDQFLAGPAKTAPPTGGSNAPAPPPGATAPGVAALVGHYSGPVPESILAVDSLRGIKEGRGGPADTLYVVFDPRCPYCRKAYEATRGYVQRGFTIKWIPAVALGNPAQGIPIAAAVVQAKPGEQADMLRRVLANKESVLAKPTADTEADLARNLNFFFAAFKTNGVDRAGVPAAFFLDKRTGKARMMTGISELPVIEEVFGKLP